MCECGLLVVLGLGPVGLAQGQSPNAGGGFIFVLLATLAIFYFILILPAQRQRKRHQKMLDALKAGDKVVTTGGLVGTVVGVKDDKVVQLRIADNVRVEIVRTYIAGHQGSAGDASKD